MKTEHLRKYTESGKPKCLLKPLA